MTDRREPPIQFRDAGIARALASRADPGRSLGSVAERDLRRYHALLAHELERVDLSRPEALLIIDALNGSRLDEASYRLLWAEVDDAVRLDGLGAKWGVAGPPLVEKLRALTPGQAMALLDATERFFATDDGSPPDERLASVGLTRRDREPEGEDADDV